MGCARSEVRFWHRCDAQSEGACGKPFKTGLEAASAKGKVRSENRTAPTAGQRERGDCPRARIPEYPHGVRARCGVFVFPHGVQEDVPSRGTAQEPIGGARREASVRRRRLLFLSYEQERCAGPRERLGGELTLQSG